MPSSSHDYDVIVVGAGHNGLICAGYLAKAGYRVAVFEKRDMVGGAVSTKEIVPGYQFDLGGSAHILIRLTPIVEELELESFGLEYLDVDPLFFAPFPDDDYFFIYRDLDRTVNHLESRFPGEGEAYLNFVDEWRPFARAVKDAFLSAPGPLDLARNFVFNRNLKMDWKAALPKIMRPYGEVVDDYFSSEKIKSALTWMAAQSGPPPHEPVSAPFVYWQPLYHEGGMARPKGGSGELTQALKKMILASGGEVFTSAPVDEILLSRNDCKGVSVNGQIYTSRCVVSAAHAHETFGRLLPGHPLGERLRQSRIGNGFGAIVRLALNRPISYSAHPGDDARVALQLVCRDRTQIQHAFGEYLCGKPTSDPPIVAMSFSAVDDTLAPKGGEVLWLWAQYYPYELADGHWDDIGPAVAENILDTFEKYAPGTKESVVGSLFQHPLWLERELGLFRGNVMHLEMSIDQMFSLRPFAEGSQYRTPIKGLYLSGASTHPGGGIMGASGRNTANVLLRDLEKRKV